MSPVVATALFLLVTVGSIGIFQGWFEFYSTDLLTNLEEDDSMAVLKSKVEELSGTNLYFKNGYNNLTIHQVKLNNVSCSINKDYGSGVQIIDISDCLHTEQKIAEVIVITNKGLFSKILPLTNAKFLYPCTLNSITRKHGENYTFYNSDSVPFYESCSFVIRTCNDGTFQGNNSYNYSSCFVEDQDIDPVPFNFIDKEDIEELDQLIYSNILTPTEYEGPLSVGVTGDGSPKIRINNGSWVTSGQIYPTETIQIRLTSPSSRLTTFSANLTFGNYSTVWNVTTSQTATSYMCYNSSYLGQVGAWEGCNNMLIVSRADLLDAVANNPLSSGKNFYVRHNDVDYTFGDSTHNIFTGQITNMRELFDYARYFNSDINYWDMSSVTDMYRMFYRAYNFNKDINSWDTSSVINMQGMFYNADDFNQDINSWDTSSVTNMREMFYSADNFNGDISSWDTS
ncbi:MAG: BspA family leucine-rich repeat surface protein, partial [Nanoarchaeota archaeon]